MSTCVPLRVPVCTCVCASGSVYLNGEFVFIVRECFSVCRCVSTCMYECVLYTINTCQIRCDINLGKLFCTVTMVT